MIKKKLVQSGYEASCFLDLGAIAKCVHKFICFDSPELHFAILLVPERAVFHSLLGMLLATI